MRALQNGSGPVWIYQIKHISEYPLLMVYRDMISDYPVCDGKTMTQDEIQFLQEFGRRVRYYRKLQALTQEQLGEKANVGYKYIGEIERGRKRASIIILLRLSQALQISLADLIYFPIKTGEEQTRYMQLIMRLMENRNTNNLKKAYQLLRVCLKED